MATHPLVLIVEDSPTQAQQLSGILGTHPLRISIAADGLEALRMVDSLAPDFIILDVTLPKMDGYQVCMRLKRDTTTAHIPVVMLTSIDTADGTLRGLEVGADDYIAKDSFMGENLLATLDAYLHIFAENESGDSANDDQ